MDDREDEDDIVSIGSEEETEESDAGTSSAGKKFILFVLKVQKNGTQFKFRNSYYYLLVVIFFLLFAVA